MIDFLNYELQLDKYPEFGLENLPFGIFSTSEGENKQVGVRVGDKVVSLKAIAQEGLLVYDRLTQLDYELNSLNSLFEFLPEIRNQLCRILNSPQNLTAIRKSFFNCEEVIMHLPIDVPDYTDFYACYNHAFHVGHMFRGEGKELMPNWKTMPIGYHGRASSIIGSNIDIKRPFGAYKESDSLVSRLTKKMDFEVELGCVIGRGSKLGEQISISEAPIYIVGFLMVNDWSARDIQAWEYQPLGPFLGKSFATSISSWLVLKEALADDLYQDIEGQEDAVSYLNDTSKLLPKVDFTVNLKTSIDDQAIVNTNSKYLHWGFDQMITHHTINGCKLRSGDLMASGTISGVKKDEMGCLLEITENGKEPLKLKSGKQRCFLEDDDEVIIHGYAVVDDRKIGFGRLINKIVNNG